MLIRAVFERWSSLGRLGRWAPTQFRRRLIELETTVEISRATI
jgi:hypothetical protein